MKSNRNDYEIRPLKPNSSFRTLAITCYEDDLIKGEAGLIDAIHRINPNYYQIVAIKHFRSENKEHFHILIRITDCKKTLKVSARLRELGITFKSGIEKRLAQNERILETCGYFPNYVVYLLHQTTDAKQDGKAAYDVTEYITNLSDGDLKEILSGYNASKRVLTKKNLPYILESIREAGYHLKNYDEVVSSFSILGLTSTNENKLRNSYNSGVQKKMRESPYLSRFCIYIEYPNASYNDMSKVNNSIEHALSSTEHVTYDINKPSPFIYPSTKAIAFINGYYNIDENIEVLCSPFSYEIGKPLFAKKQLWLGSMIIVAAIPVYDSIKKNFMFRADPLKDTFVCKIENNKLICKLLPRNGFASEDSYNMMCNQFKMFRDAFNIAYVQASTRFWGKLDDINN